MSTVYPEKDKSTSVAKMDGFVGQLKFVPDYECETKLKEMQTNEDPILSYTYQPKEGNETSIEGENQEELRGQNLLHLAVCFEKNTTATYLSKHYPKLITQHMKETSIQHPKKSIWNYRGLTPFHIAVAHGNRDLVKHMHKLANKEELRHIMHGTYIYHKGPKFGTDTPGTVFMGELPLHVAVLSYINNTVHTEEDDVSVTDDHLNMINEFLQNDKWEMNLKKTNYRGDTVFHSIMRFVNCFPKREDKAKIMMAHLHRLMQERITDESEERDIFLAVNDDGQSALQLATEFGLTILFKVLLEIKGVYYVCQPHDDIYEIARFDVTEFDRFHLQETRRVEQPGHLSVSELLCSRHSLDDAATMINATVFEAVIRKKWLKYRWYCLVFFCFHLFNVVSLNVFIIAKGTQIANKSFGPSNFVLGWSIYFLVVGLLYLIQEIPRYFIASQKFAWGAVHHNVVYRCCLLITGFCLVIDSAINFAPDIQNNWFLLFALITSTWFFMFFLRAFRFLSVYTVLINEALFKAVLPFAVLIFLQLFTFSSSMHSFFLDLEPGGVADPFETYGKSLLAMGKLMIGLTEIDNLLSTNQDVLAVFAFGLFLLVTFLLMINALIGVLTNRFEQTQRDKVQVTLMQKLSILIFFEGWFFGYLKKLAVSAGIEQSDKDRYINKGTQNARKSWIISFRKVPSGQADKPSNIEHELKRSHNKLDEIQKDIARLLENQLQRSKGPASLHVYHYKKE